MSDHLDLMTASVDDLVDTAERMAAALTELRLAIAQNFYGCEAGTGSVLHGLTLAEDGRKDWADRISISPSVLRTCMEALKKAGL